MYIIYIYTHWEISTYHAIKLVFLLEKTIRFIGEQNENFCSQCTIADFEQW